MNVCRYIPTLASLAGIIMLAASCSGDDNSINNPTDKVNRPSWSAEIGRKADSAPTWVPVSDESLTSSMTITAGLSDNFTAITVTEDDMLAAFSGQTCLGVATPMFTYSKPRFYLYVLPPTDSKKMVTLAYYNAKSNKLYYWVDAIHFENNKTVGSVLHAYELNPSSENGGMERMAKVSLSVPDSKKVQWGTDELAAFVNGQCRRVLTEQHKAGDNQFTFTLPIVSTSDKVSIRYYSYSEDRVYASREYDVTDEGLCQIDVTDWK